MDKNIIKNYINFHHKIKQIIFQFISYLFNSSIQTNIDVNFKFIF